MIFNEIYSAYYNAVAKIVSEILKGNADEKALSRIVSDTAFGESMMTILPSLKNEKWQIMHKDFSTPLQYAPTMPLTLVQKEWLKAISLDKRIKLFDIDFSFLEGVEPLFTEEDYFIYDKYADGDPYGDEKYVAHFRTILKALNEKRNLKIEMANRKGNTVYARCVPERLEYSEKDDKFRLVTSGCRFLSTVNLARITKCHIYNGDDEIESDAKDITYETITLKVSEERNTLERCMLHFAHFEKRAERVGDHYLLHVRFSREDESEMVIRVLSFGPLVEVIESEHFKNLIIAKLKSQKGCELF